MREFFQKYENATAAINDLKQVAKIYRLCNLRRHSGTFKSAVLFAEQAKGQPLQVVIWLNGVISIDLNTNANRATENRAAVATIIVYADGCAMHLQTNEAIYK